MTEPTPKDRAMLYRKIARAEAALVDAQRVLAWQEEQAEYSKQTIAKSDEAL